MYLCSSHFFSLILSLNITRKIIHIMYEDENILIKLSSASINHDDYLVLSDVNLKIERNEFVYLIGKVGSGKTSVIKTIDAELPMKEGEGYVAGFDLKKIKRSQIPFLRRKLGIVFQDFQLLIDRSVEENLSFVLRATGWKSKEDIKKRIEEVLTKVGLEFKGYKYPHQLSGGEQQRVVIARALLNDPSVILADEPTGNLDPDTSEDIFKLLLDISKNETSVLMATHNYTLLKKYPSRTFKCENGTLVEEKQPQEIDFNSIME